MSSDDHRELLRDSIRGFLARGRGLQRVRALRGATPAFDRAYWRELADLGCVGAMVAAQHGGSELGLSDMAAMLQALGPALLPEPVIEVAVGATGLLALAPDSALAARLLPAIASGELVPGLAWQAPGAEWPGEAFVFNGSTLSGKARFVLPADADGWLLIAQGPECPLLCWVAAPDAQAAFTRELRIDETPSGLLELKDFPLAPHRMARITHAGLQRVVNDCQLGIAASLLGISDAVLQTTLDYLRTREQFGKPIGSFQALQHRAVDLYTRQQLARAALDAALDGMAQQHSARSYAIAASRAKARAADTALAICREAVQMHGAMGFADECDIGLHLKRVLVLSAWLGNAGIHRARIAALLAEEPAVASRSSAPATASPEPADPGRPDWSAMPDEAFRAGVRAIFEREYPAALRNPPRRLRWKECHAFYRKLGEVGLLALAWPKAFGGAGLSPRQQLIFMQEQDRWGVARAPDMGLTMVGPGLIRHGTPAQQQRYLGPILAMEHMWCQGFSEPNAGSDLASLRTEAVRQGDEYRINGSKIWTTFAQDASHMFLLARTDRQAKKQAGISVFLIDLATPGITVRPIRDIAGHEEFCEVHFQDVQVPADSVLGPVNGGWTVAKMLLAQERIYLGNPRQAQYALKRLDEAAQAMGLMSDAVFVERLTRLRLDVWDLASLYERFADQVRRGEPLGADVSILKLMGSETGQRISELAVQALGASGALAGAVPLGDRQMDLMSLFMNARPTTIYGGSSEVQRNVLAKQVLDLA